MRCDKNVQIRNFLIRCDTFLIYSRIFNKFSLLKMNTPPQEPIQAAAPIFDASTHHIVCMEDVFKNKQEALTQLAGVCILPFLSPHYPFLFLLLTSLSNTTYNHHLIRSTNLSFNRSSEQEVGLSYVYQGTRRVLLGFKETGEPIISIMRSSSPPLRQ